MKRDSFFYNLGALDHSEATVSCLANCGVCDFVALYKVGLVVFLPIHFSFPQSYQDLFIRDNIIDFSQASKQHHQVHENEHSTIETIMKRQVVRSQAKDRSNKHEEVADVMQEVVDMVRIGIISNLDRIKQCLRSIHKMRLQL